MMVAGRWYAVVDTQEATNMDTPLTLQEAFNKIWERAKDKVKAIERFNEDPALTGCRYRASNGKKCFVGVLIPDEQYTPEMEGELFSIIEKSVPCIRGLDHQLLCKLQEIHDSWKISEWDFALRNFAIMNKLTVPD